MFTPPKSRPRLPLISEGTTLLGAVALAVATLAIATPAQAYHQGKKHTVVKKPVRSTGDYRRSDAEDARATAAVSAASLDKPVVTAVSTIPAAVTPVSTVTPAAAAPVVTLPESPWEADVVRIEHPVVQYRIGQGNVMAPIYLSITPTRTMRLVGARSPYAGKVYLANNYIAGGDVAPYSVPAIELNANQPVTFAQGKYSLVLADLTQPLQQGMQVPVTLIFEDANGARRTVSTQVTVSNLTQ